MNSPTLYMFIENNPFQFYGCQIKLFKEIYLENGWTFCKQWRPWSYAIEYGFLSQPALFGKSVFVWRIWVTWPRWLSCPYMVKRILNSSFLELKELGIWHWDSGPTKFVKTMTLRWPWCVLPHQRPMVDFKIIWQQWLGVDLLLSSFIHMILGKEKKKTYSSNLLHEGLC